MGRKPNQVVLQYFDRGPKLDDSSNRYQHTCKACGAFFPKGRIEGLVNHLTKKCPSLAPSQKQHIVIQFYNLAGPDSTGLPLAGNNAQNDEQLGIGNRATFSVRQAPVPVGQNFNSLNILAEASRRVGGTSTTADPLHPPQPTQPPPPSSSLSSKDAGSGFVSFDNHLDPGIPLDPTLDMDSFTHSYLHDEDGLNTNISNSLVDPVAPPRPELSSIAASATEMLPGGGSSVGGVDGDRQASDLPPSAIDGEAQGLSADKSKLLATSINCLEMQTQTQHAHGAPATIPKETHFVAGPGTSFKLGKPKVRGKFGPVRRQEVREMRQRGACLRCRMLKKTCSNGSPCQACAAIETPRIWKTPCIRTKLTNEFSLYTVGLYNTTIFRELAQLKLQSVPQESRGLLEFYLLDGSPIGLSFGETRLQLIEGYYHNNNNNNNLHQLHQHYQQDMQATGEDGTAISENRSVAAVTAVEELEYSIISSDTEEIARAMEVYLSNKIEDSETLGANEKGCIKASVRTLAVIAKQKNNGLLRRILLLWTSTLFLVDEGSSSKWEAAVVSPPPLILEGDRMETGEHIKKEAAAAAAAAVAAAAAAAAAARLPQKVSGFSNRLVLQQLRAGVEMQAKSLNKIILAELERRLVQKQRDGQFETFMALLLLLNCFERLCWGFKAQEAAAAMQQSPDKWPFPQSSADDFSRQGERFAEIIEVLADMRGLIPQTRFDPAQNNILVPVDRKYNKESAIAINYTSVNARASTTPEEQQLVRNWFQEAGLTQEYLQLNSNIREKASSPSFDPTDFRSMDGRFFLRLLLPDANQLAAGGSGGGSGSGNGNANANGSASVSGNPSFWLA